MFGFYVSKYGLSTMGGVLNQFKGMRGNLMWINCRLERSGLSITIFVTIWEVICHEKERKNSPLGGFFADYCSFPAPKGTMHLIL